MSGMIRLQNTGDQIIKIGNNLIFSNSFIVISGRKGLMDEAELDCINMGGADVKWQ